MTSEMEIVEKALVCVVFVEILVVLMGFFLGSSNATMHNPALDSFTITENNLNVSVNGLTGSFNEYQNATGWLDAIGSFCYGLLKLVYYVLAILLIGIVAMFKLLFEVIPSIIKIGFGNGGIGAIFSYISIAGTLAIGFFIVFWLKSLWK